MVSLPSRPRGIFIEHTSEIRAPAAVIWEVLAAVDQWGDWNPIYPEARGRLGLGERLSLTIALPGMKPQKSTAAVLQASPEETLHFGTPALGGLLFTTRFLEISATAGGTCTVINGEAFGGLFAPLLVGALRAKLGEGLRLQTEGLKAAAEARAGASP